MDALLKNKIEFIEDYQFSDSFFYKLKETYNYSNYEISLLIDGLKDFFIIHLIKENDVMIGMNSMHIDNAWHTFILHTREYINFCEKIYGRYLHHEPGMIKPLVEQNDKTMFVNTIFYLEKVKNIRTKYQTEDLNKLKILPYFYSMYLIEELIFKKMDYQLALESSVETIQKITL